MNLDHHPCFNPSACSSYGRVHLPVAPRCNIQCNFCNRKFDCVNESRPGVTSGVLSPAQAMRYLSSVFEEKSGIAVVGIAGPGDPFANPEETLETLRRVRQRYPEVLLCVATNGLNLVPYIDELADLKVTHVTVTINAVDPKVGAEIYAWVRHNRRVHPARRGAALLLENQLSAVEGLKRRGIIVKVNAIVIPGVNDGHIEAVARKMAALEVDILNCVPYFPAAGSAFAHLAEPQPERIETIRRIAGRHVAQMRHCTRCRADAVGLLGEAPDLGLMKRLQQCESTAIDDNPSDRSRVAVASMEGVLVNQHLGEAEQLLIYAMQDGMVSLVESRRTPERGGGDRRWQALTEMLADCEALLVSGVGAKPKTTLSAGGIRVLEIEGLIEDALRAVFSGESLDHLARRQASACRAGCGGGGLGCG
jgi:nitrogen fixation protein NifB